MEKNTERGMAKCTKMKVTASLVMLIMIAGVVSISGCLEEGGESIEVTVLSPPDMQASLESGKIAGYVAWEPYCSDSIHNGYGKALYWSGDIWPNHPCCVVAVDNDYADANPDVVKHFLKAHIEANKWMADALANPDSDDYQLLVDIAVEFTSRDAEIVKDAMEHVKFGYALDDGFMSGLQKYTEKLIDFELVEMSKLEDNGYDGAEDFVDKYADKSYLQAADSVTPTNQTLATVRVGYLVGDIHQLAYKIASSDDVGGGTSFFKQYGIEVVDATGAPYPNGGAVMDHFASGDIDIGYLGSAPAVLKHLNAGIDISIVAQANSEGSAIIVANDIDSLEDLKGKSFGIPGFPTVQYFLLRMVAEKEGIDVTGA